MWKSLINYLFLFFKKGTYKFDNNFANLEIIDGFTL